MKYMVVMDGCDGYGANIYFVGLFEDGDSAKKVVEECKQHLKERDLLFNDDIFEIIEVNENQVHYPYKTYPDSKYYNDLCTDIFLGGYAE